MSCGLLQYLMCRIFGWLPSECRDEWIACETLVYLAVVEPGENWCPRHPSHSFATENRERLLEDLHM